MKTGTKILTIFLVAVMLLTLFPAAVLAESDVYSASDIAVINNIIENNGLNWTKWESGSTPPVDWIGVTWDDGEPRRIRMLYVNNKGLEGVLDVSALNALETLECDQNELAGLNISGLHALNWLYCSKNRLTSLDVSGLHSLGMLRCTGNQLTNIDLDGLDTLGTLDCCNNQLANLDLGGLDTLGLLDCCNNRLTNLSLAGLGSLQLLYCRDNQLTSLNLSSLDSLTHLCCDGNQLKNLDFRDLSSLEELSCSQNQLTSLNVSGFNKLKSLYCCDNQLIGLDTSGLSSLYYLACWGNQLTDLNLSDLNLLTYLNCSDNNLTSLVLNSKAPFFLIDVRNNLMKDPSAITGQQIDWDTGSFYFTPQKAPAEISLNKTKLILAVGESETLIASHTGVGGSITWTSDNPSLVSVNNAGKVMARSAGRATVKASLGGQMVACTVNVTGAVSPAVQSISLSDSYLSLNIAETRSLLVNFNPTNVVNKRVTWTSSNPSVATVDTKGKVTGKSVGTAVITAKTEVGDKESRCNITVTPFDLIVDLAPGISFSTNVNGPSLTFLGKNFTLFNLPLCISFKYANIARAKYDLDEQKYIAMFGDFKDFKDDPQARQKAYHKIKSLMAMMGKANYRDFYKEWKDLIKAEKPLIVDGNATVFGYLEYVMNNNQLVLANGELGVLFAADATWKQPLPVPLTFFKFKIKGEAQGGFKLVLEEAGNILSGIFPYGNLESSLAVSGALGFDAFVADVYGGVEGELKGKLNLPPLLLAPFVAQRDLSLKAKLTAFLEYKAFFFWGEKISWKFKDWQLYPPEERSGIFSGDCLMGISPEDFKLLPRDYLDNQPKMYRSLTTTDGGITVIESNIFPNGQTKLLDLGDGRLLMLWIGDAGIGRSSANRTALHYSIYDGTDWSAPLLVEDDATADFAFDACVTDSKVFVVWQNAEMVFDDDVYIEDVARNIELKAIELSTSPMVFGPSTVLYSSAEGLSALPTVCAANDNQAAISWVSNSAHDFTGSSGNNSLYVSTFNGEKWNKADQIYTTAQTIQSTASIYDGAKHKIAYSSGDNTTEGAAAEIYIVSAGEEPARITANEVVDSRPMFLNNNGLTELYWYSGSDILMTPDINSVAAPIMVLPDANAVRGFDIANNAATTMLYWESTKGLNTHIDAIFYDNTSEQWSDPVTITEGYDGRLVGSSGILKNDGTILLSYITAKKEEIDDDDPFGFSDLLFESVEPHYDLAVVSEAMYDPDDVIAGDLLPVSLEIQNNGLSLVEKCEVSLTDSSGHKLFSSIEAINLGQGEICDLEIDYPLPDILTGQMLTICVLPYGNTAVLPDKTLFDNAVTFEIGLANLFIENPRLSGAAGTRELAVDIVNRGYSSSSPVTISLSDNETGEVLQKQYVDSVPARENAVVKFELDITQFHFEEGTDDFALEIEMSSENENEINYIPRAIVLLGNPYRGDVFEISPSEKTGSSLVFEIANNLFDEQDGILLFQQGDDENLVTHGQEIAVPPLSRQSFEFDLAAFGDNEQDNLKIFITNSDDEVISNLQLVSLTQNMVLHRLTLVNSVGGINTFGSSGDYAEGDIITAIADIAPSGQIFNKWISSDGVIFADAYSETTTFIMPGHATTVEATYKTHLDEDKYQVWPGGVIPQAADWEPTIVFNKPVDSKTLAGITVWRRTAEGGLQEVIVSPQSHQDDDKIVLVRHGVPFAEGNYLLLIGPGVETATGELLKQPIKYEFKVSRPETEPTD